MKSIISILAVFLICKITIAQSGKPMIGSDADVKEKITMIKNALPDIIKAFGKNGVSDGTFTKYQADLTIGKAQITLQQYNPNLSQEMDIDFNRFNYDGTKDDFKKFFDELVNETKDILGKSFYTDGLSVSADLDDQESVFFYEKGKSYDSPVQIDLFYSPRHRSVDIVIKSKK
jgi:hypothetical protein